MGLLTAPFNGLFLLFKEIAERAEEELNDDGPILAELTDLYKCLEAKTVSEEDFALREAALVERLEVIEQRKKRKRSHGIH
jgi:hypothetical protein